MTRQNCWTPVGAALGLAISLSSLAAQAGLTWAAPSAVHDVRGGLLNPTGTCAEDWCLDDLWFAGENRETGAWGYPTLDVPDFDDLGFTGTDLGVSVYLPYAERTIVYMGDSWGTPWSGACHASLAGQPNKRCDDAILRLDDDDPSDGLDASVLIDEATNHFAPLTLPGVNKVGGTAEPNLGPFNVPTGAAVRPKKLLTAQLTVDHVWLWYAVGLVGSSPRSYLACSTGGVSFTGCFGSQAALFSTDKFVQVSPVYVSAADWAIATGGTACSATLRDPSPLCSLRTALGRRVPGDGFLLFGDRGGASYRNSSLYLAYLDASTGDVYYYTNPYQLFVSGPSLRWIKGDESKAIAILTATAAAASKMGELSVQIARDTDGYPYLVMLSNHSGAPVQYRTSSIVHPQRWTAPVPTNAAGYGPYILSEFTQVDETSSQLELYHLISSWNGLTNALREPYGVFSTPLELEDGARPAWPPAHN